MADGIPYPQAPSYNVPNPLQQMSQMSALAQRAQAMEQQELVNRAKQAVGRHMQMHINSATGELDDQEFVKTLATDPEAAMAFPEVIQMLDTHGSMKAATAGKLLENQRQKMDMVIDAAGGLAAKIGQGENISSSDFAGFVGGLASREYFKNSDDASKFLLAAAGQVNPQDPQGYNKLFTRLLNQTKSGRDILESNMLTIQQAMTPVEMTGAMGTPYTAPAYQTGRVPRPMARMLESQEGMSPGGPSAPRFGQMAREGEQPSVPPPVSDVPDRPGIVRKGVEPAYREAKQYYDKEDHWLRKTQAEAENAANTAVRAENTMQQQLELLRQFEQGPGMETRAALAESLRGIGGSESIVKSLLGAKPGSKDALGAMQAARKFIYESAAQAMQTAEPGARYSDYDLKAAMKGTPSLSTSKAAEEIVFKHMQNAFNIAKERAQLVGRYVDWSLANPGHTRAFKQHYLEQSTRDWLTHSGLLRTGPVDAGAKKENK